MNKEKILKQLNPEQADAAGTIFGPVLILAGAGTGKTRVITYRIAYMLASGIPAEQILGLTFTNKAAREMRERLAAIIDPALAKKVTLGTFHSFCMRLLRHEIHRLGYLASFTISDESDQQGLLKQAAANCGCNYEGFPLGDVQGLISSWKNKLLFPSDAKRAAESDFEAAAADVYESYQSLLELQNSLDFDDMLLLVHKLFSDYPDVLEHYREIYQFLLIDEYQDTNAAQFTIVKMLTGERGNLCVVGDDDQSIYSWRGADISNILNFPDYFANTKVVKLEQNYRSTGKILAAANAAIGGNRNRHEKKLWSNLGEGENVRLVTAPDGESESSFIASMIHQLRGERPELKFSDFAILYRSNHLSRQIEGAMRQSMIPYRLVGGQEFFKRKEIKDAVAYLKLLVNPRDDQSLLRILGIPPRGLADKAVKQLKLLRESAHRPMAESLGSEDFLKAVSGKGATAAKELAETFRKYREIFRNPGKLAPTITQFLREVGYLDGLQKIYKDLEDAVKRRENVDEFINAIAQFESKQTEPPTLESYLESYSLLEEEDRTEEDDANADSVTLSTVHASKGLEYKIVFVIALEQNIFPHERAVKERSTDEELRLFYVAITRARELLFLTKAKQRFVKGVSRPQFDSPFLELLPEDLLLPGTPETFAMPASPERRQKAFDDIFKLLDE